MNFTSSTNTWSVCDYQPCDIYTARRYTKFPFLAVDTTTKLHSALYYKTLAMAYSDDAVKAKLAALSETQDSIVTVAQWIMFHRYAELV